MHQAIRSLFKHTLVVVALLQGGWAAAGALYTWVDAEGNKHISDRPPIGETYNTKLETTKKGTGTAPGKKLFAPAAASAASAAASGSAATAEVLPG